MTNSLYIQDIHQKLFNKFKLLPGNKYKNLQDFYVFLTSNSAELHTFLSANCIFEPVVINNNIITYLK